MAASPPEPLDRASHHVLAPRSQVPAVDLHELAQFLAAVAVEDEVECPPVSAHAGHVRSEDVLVRHRKALRPCMQPQVVHRRGSRSVIVAVDLGLGQEGLLVGLISGQASQDETLRKGFMEAGPFSGGPGRSNRAFPCHAWCRTA